MSWTVPQSVTVIGWNGALTQVGTRVTVVASEWSRSLPPGESVVIGHVGTGIPQPAPTTVELNGQVCSTGLS